MTDILTISYRSEALLPASRLNVQPRVQSERLLLYIIEMVRRLERIENQVPAMTGYRRGDQDEKVLPE